MTKSHIVEEASIKCCLDQLMLNWEIQYKQNNRKVNQKLDQVVPNHLENGWCTAFAAMLFSVLPCGHVALRPGLCAENPCHRRRFRARQDRSCKKANLFLASVLVVLFGNL